MKMRKRRRRRLRRLAIEYRFDRISTKCIVHSMPSPIDSFAKSIHTMCSALCFQCEFCFVFVCDLSLTVHCCCVSVFQCRSFAFSVPMSVPMPMPVYLVYTFLCLGDSSDSVWTYADAPWPIDC